MAHSALKGILATIGTLKQTTKSFTNAQIEAAKFPHALAPAHACHAPHRGKPSLGVHRFTLRLG